MRITIKSILIAGSLMMGATALAASNDTITLDVINQDGKAVQSASTYGDGQFLRVDLYGKLPYQGGPTVFDVTCKINNTAPVAVEMSAENLGVKSPTIDKDGYSQDYYLPQFNLMLNGIHGTRDHFTVQPGANTLVVQHIDGWPPSYSLKDEGIVLHDLAPVMLPNGGGDSKVFVYNCTATPSPKARRPRS
ncbi:MAG: hypothetical protein P1U34_11390 [Coxiellaceae bacterium]|nr:hypothetical protein [Coxiellaceae bacterium]